MFGKKQLPVYLFTGFLESGKTSFIRETLLEGQFADGKETLLITCEEGEEEIPEELIQKNKITVHTVDEEEDITPELFEKYDKECRPARVLIESNGTWDVNTIIEAFPDHWMMGECITTVDSATYEVYLGNMKQMMMAQFTYSELVVFNRCTEDYDRAMFKRTVRAVNKRAQILFETPDGKVDDKVSEELPFDIHADVIEISDEDFGIWYLDAMDNLNTYEGKTVRFKGVVYQPKRSKEDVFVPGRFAMTCCADDVAFVGFPCKYTGAKSLVQRDWVMVTARVGSAMSREYGKKAPVLFAGEVKPASAAEEELVYFN